LDLRHRAELRIVSGAMRGRANVPMATTTSDEQQSSDDGNGRKSPLRFREGIIRWLFDPTGTSIPELSVIVPLFDDHGMAEVCLESWKRQTCAGERLQLVVVDHGVGASRARRLKERMGGGDLWIDSADAIESVLYDRGARAAGAPLLLFTEAHCVARPDAAKEVLRCFRDDGLSAAVVGGGHLDDGHPLSRMQAALERDWAAAWPAGHFRMLSLRGFAIRRDAYLALGGFQRAHGRFCETAMGIALARSGRRIGQTAPVIDHANCTRMADLVAALAGCARGQLAWRAEMDARMPGLADEWLGEIGIWKRRNTLAPATSRSLLRVIARSLVADLGRRGFFGKARGILRNVPWLLTGALPRGLALRFLARLRTARAAARWWIARATGAPLESCYRDLWNSAFARGYLEYLGRHPLAPEWEDVTDGRQSIAEFSEGALAGLHAADHAGRPGRRWTGTAALVRLRFRPRDATLRLTWQLPRSSAESVLTVFFNGRRVPAEALHVDRRSLEVRVTRAECRSDGGQELSFTCRGFRSELDPHGRLFGAALFDLMLRPARRRNGASGLFSRHRLASTGNDSWSEDAHAGAGLGVAYVPAPQWDVEFTIASQTHRSPYTHFVIAQMPNGQPGILSPTTEFREYRVNPVDLSVTRHFLAGRPIAPYVRAGVRYVGAPDDPAPGSTKDQPASSRA
jgi:hypothetical protein